MAVNGDLPSLVLFGSMALWAVVEMVVINATDGPWQRPEPGPIREDVKLIVGSLVAFGVIAAIHTWLGVYPFPM